MQQIFLFQIVIIKIRIAQFKFNKVKSNLKLIVCLKLLKRKIVLIAKTKLRKFQTRLILKFKKLKI
jgi:hypothetical protein